MLREGQMVNDLNVRTRDRLSVVMAFVLLASLLAAWRWPPLLGLAGLAMLSVLALNAGLFRFFRRRRGALFALGTIPLYWAFLLIGGSGFALGLVRHLLRRRE
jgi:hypothetical protein